MPLYPVTWKLKILNVLCLWFHSAWKVREKDAQQLENNEILLNNFDLAFSFIYIYICIPFPLPYCQFRIGKSGKERRSGWKCFCLSLFWPSYSRQSLKKKPFLSFIHPATLILKICTKDKLEVTVHAQEIDGSILTAYQNPLNLDQGCWFSPTLCAGIFRVMAFDILWCWKRHQIQRLKMWV